MTFYDMLIYKYIYTIWGKIVKAITYTIKIRDNFIQKPQTLNTPIVNALLCVKVREIWDRGKHDSNFIIGLAVKFLYKVK